MGPALPFEILSNIAVYVDPKKNLACALVCKQWTEPFLNKRWCSITVTLEVAKYICNTRSQNNVYLKNLHRTLELKLMNIPKADMKYLSKVQQIYCKINWFEYDRPYRSDCIIQEIDWSPWKSLVHLSIPLCNRSLTASEDFFTKLSVLSCLTHLTLKEAVTQQSLEETIVVSWQDIELLHLNLPRLTYIDIRLRIKAIPAIDANKIRRITPAHAITNIRYGSDYIDAFWVFYFALKYPNLHNITLGRSFESGGHYQSHTIDYDKKKYQEGVRLLLTLDRFFPRLRSIFTSMNSFNRYQFSVFYNALWHFDVKLKDVELSFEGEKLDWAEGSQSCLNIRSDALASLKITLSSASSLNPVGDLLFVYPDLVELQIETYNLIEVNIILDKCPSLRDLRMKGTEVSFSGKLKRVDTPHALQRLELDCVSTSTHMLEYISRRCKGLLFLKLYSIRFRKSYSDELDKLHHTKYPYHLVLNMSFLNLDTLVIYRLRRFGNIKFCAIQEQHQGDEEEDIKKMEDGNCKSLVPDEPSQLAGLKWYHLCWKNTEGVKRASMWELEKQDIDYVKGFYKHYVSLNYVSKDSDYRDNIYNGYSPKRFWQKDLQNGFLTIRLKSVKAIIHNKVFSYYRNR
ncbi:hypothetical protein J3Q64DRAFT_1772366 [Phycomyces blakesleeanus]